MSLENIEEEGEETPEEREERLRNLYQKLNKESDVEGVPLIHKIVDERMSDLLVYCFERGFLPKVDEFDKGNQTPLMVAIEKNDIPMVKVLIEKGANVTVRHYQPVHICANAPKSGEQVEIMRMLLDRGADLNVQQMTPLHLTALNNNFLLAKFLLDSQVDRTIKSIRGLEAHEVARAADVKKFIRDFGKKKKKEGGGRGKRFKNAYSPILNKSKSKSGSGKKKR